MSTAARKARKRAGIQFVHPVKVGTPLAKRAHVLAAKRRRAEKLIAKSSLMERLQARFRRVR